MTSQQSWRLARTPSLALRRRKIFFGLSDMAIATCRLLAESGEDIICIMGAGRKGDFKWSIKVRDSRVIRPDRRVLSVTVQFNLHSSVEELFIAALVAITKAKDKHMTKQITLGDILTDSEIERAKALYLSAARGTFAKRCANEIIGPVLARIDEALGQKNDALYMAYAVEYAISQSIQRQ